MDTFKSPLILVLTGLVLGACQRSEAPATVAPGVNNDVKMGTYRVVLQTPGGELPFGLELAQKDSKPVGYLINGEERLLLSEVKIAGSHLEIRMPGYENVLKADAAGNQLLGEIFLVKPNEKNQHVPLRATLGDRYRFFKTPVSDNADVSGRWAVKFIDDSGVPEVALGEFSQSHDFVSGTILTTTGDHRYLAGQVKGDELYLSTFDGAHVFLYKAKITADGGLDGDWWSGLAFHEKWVGKRDAAAKLPDAYGVTAMRAGVKQFDFVFPDLDGKTVSSKDAQFRGKVLIVALAGSWCPNCHDEAAFLEPLYKEYRGKGLEIVSLQFEHFGDFPRAAEATKRFRQHYGIEYTTLIAGISDKDEAGKKLPMLQSFVAFPTTVFIDRKGNVRKIHTGYTGPATGDHYVQFVTEVKSTLDQLLAET
ncbi:MAG TPA: TlpA disulfide reductase family protein [Steroidobacteraceae bacterium]|nr:TlpA disulfide reductase family protein [Steroidobacteraceae bacterium]